MKNTTIALLVVLVAGASGVFLYKKFAQVRTQNAVTPTPTVTGSEVVTSQVTSISNTNDIITISATSSLPIAVATYGELPSPFIVKSNNSLFLVGLDKSVKQLISFDVPNLLLPLPLTNENKYGDLYIGAKLSTDRRWVVIDYGVNKYNFGYKKNGVGIIDLKDPKLKLRVFAPVEVRMYSNFEFSPDGKFLGLTSGAGMFDRGDSSLIIFNTATGDTVFENTHVEGSIVWLNSTDFSYISGEKLRTYSLTTRKEQEIPAENITATMPAFESPDSPVIPEFSPDRRYVSYINASSTLTVFDTLTKRSIVLGGTRPQEVDCCVSPSAQSLGFSKDSKSFHYKDHILNEATENPYDGRYAEYEITLLDITNSLKKELNIVTPTVPSGYYKDYNNRIEIKHGSGDFLYVWEKEKVAPVGILSYEFHHSDYAITNRAGGMVCPNFPFEKFNKMELNIFAGKPIAIASVDIYDVAASSDRAGKFTARGNNTAIVKKMIDLTTCSVFAEVSSKDPNLSLVY